MEDAMSVTHDGRQIRCDGTDCNAVAALPVALRPVLTPRPHQKSSTAEGWLFVSRGGCLRHYCPACVYQHFRVLFPFEPRDNGLQDEENRRKVLRF